MDPAVAAHRFAPVQVLATGIDGSIYITQQQYRFFFPLFFVGKKHKSFRLGQGRLDGVYT